LTAEWWNSGNLALLDSGPSFMSRRNKMNPFGVILIVFGVAAALIPIVVGFFHQHYSGSADEHLFAAERQAMEAELALLRTTVVMAAPEGQVDLEGEDDYEEEEEEEELVAS
jgi:hypothetical protein